MASVLRQLAASTSQRGDTRHANTLTIRARLSLAFGLILLVTVVIAGTYLNALSALCALAKHVEDRSAIWQAETEAIGTTGQWVLVIGETVSVVLGVLFAFLVTRSILVPLRQGIASAEAIAQGDLAQAIPVGGRDETAQLLQALSHMQDNLARIVGSVREGSESVSTASAEIAPGNHELSARTEQQASASTVAVFRLGGGAPAPYAGMAPHAAALRLK